jgi:hypothetical protein
MVATILFGSMALTRRRNFRILQSSSSSSKDQLGYLDSDTGRSSDALLAYPDSDSDADYYSPASTTPAKHPPKVRRWCCTKLALPNTSRFRNNIHSRILQRFPFLIEMFYWIINYAFYRMTAVLSARLFAGRGIWDVSQDHGIAVLAAEDHGLLSFLFPVKEQSVQQWFMHGHQDALTVLNKCYALVHIPGTVGLVLPAPYHTTTINVPKLTPDPTASSPGTTTSHPPSPPSPPPGVR